MDKLSVKILVEREKEKLGAYAKVATRIGISAAALSGWLKGDYGADEGKLTAKIAAALSYKESGWHFAPTRGNRELLFQLKEAKELRLFLAISAPAGLGKTACINHYADTGNNIYVLRCREYTARHFLRSVVTLLGIEEPKGYVTINQRIDLICRYFLGQRDKRPQLILDEADKLRPSALRTLIPIYNDCEDVLSVVICGTGNLKKEIKNGVKNERKGYDEIDSRFGRTYLEMNGATGADVRLICEANGIADKAVQARVLESVEKTPMKIEGRDVKVIKDMRYLKRMIQRELFLLQN